ncbi:MAG: serine hydrolase [Saprospiraceae bacterium]|nr:serine hydrolase [Saprospiraceae bacterium]
MHLPWLVLLLIVCQSPLKAQPVQQETLDAFIQEGMDIWKVPGLSVAVVHDGEVKFIKAYGYQQLGKPDAVDLRTLGMMGSTTKAITALAVAMLVDDGKLDWSERVNDILPAFQLKDPYITRELTVRDLLCHRSGIGNTDLLWFSGLSADETMHRMRYAETAYSLRSDYIYQNVMYLAAGRVIEARSGSSWSSFIEKRIFGPLGMSETVSFAVQAQDKGHYLRPHHRIDGKIVPIAQVTAEGVAPAGDVWGSITDMSKWMQFLLDSCRIGETRLLSRASYQELFRPHTIIPRAKFYPTTVLTNPHWTTYGLGWFQQDYRGEQVQYHTGSLPGLVAILGLVPSRNFGVYVFGNLDHAELRHAIMWKAIDLYLHDLDDRDWNAEVWELYETQRLVSQVREGKIKSERQEDAPPNLPLSAFVGTYTNELLGQIKLTQREENLHLSFNHNLTSILEHWHHHTFRYRWAPYSNFSMITFQQDNTGGISGFKLSGAHFQRKIAASKDQ